MRIAFVNQPWATPLPPSESIAIWINEVGRRLATLRDVAGVTVYALGGDEPPQPELHEGVEYRYVHGTHSWSHPRRLDPARWPRRADRPFFASSLYQRGYARGIARDLRRRRCDVVHVMNFPQFVPLLRRAAGRPATVLHMRCEWLSDLDPRLNAPRVRHAGLVLGCSDHVTGRIAATLPQIAGRCATLHNGVDTGRFRPAAGRPARKRILFVSRVSPEKGVHVLFEAFDRVLDRHPDAELELVGAEAHVQLDMLASISRDEHVRELVPLHTAAYLDDLRARFPRVTARLYHGGGIEYAEVAAKYRRADVLVAPSLSEAFGNGVVEAMASGLPVVATRLGGHLDTIDDGRTGLLVRPGDAGDLAAAVVRLLDDEALRRSMGEAAREHAARLFSWQRIVGALLDHYRRLLEDA